MKPLGLTANRLAAELSVPVTRVNDIVRGRRAITADTALRLARYFGTTPRFWVALQSNYDLELAQDARGAEIAGRVLSVPEQLVCLAVCSQAWHTKRDWTQPATSCHYRRQTDESSSRATSCRQPSGSAASALARYDPVALLDGQETFGRAHSRGRPDADKFCANLFQKQQLAVARGGVRLSAQLMPGAFACTADWMRAAREALPARPPAPSCRNLYGASHRGSV